MKKKNRAILPVDDYLDLCKQNSKMLINNLNRVMIIWYKKTKQENNDLAAKVEKNRNAFALLEGLGITIETDENRRERSLKWQGNKFALY